jgi:hypothetical protein
LRDAESYVWRCILGDGTYKENAGTSFQDGGVYFRSIIKSSESER